MIYFENKLLSYMIDIKGLLSQKAVLLYLTFNDTEDEIVNKI